MKEMAGGPEVQEVQALNRRLGEAVSFCDSAAAFARERADLENDYARRLGALAQKYAQRHDAGHISATPGSNASTLSTEACWATLLKQTEGIAQSHKEYSQTLHSQVIDQLVAAVSKTNQARKKHEAFFMDLCAARDLTYAEKDKAESKYKQLCTSLATVREKAAMTPDGKAGEKLRRRLKEEMIDVGNGKNTYILSVLSANTVKSRFHNTDVPALLEDMLSLLQHTLGRLQTSWQSATSLQQTLASSVEESAKSMKEAVGKVNVEADAQAYAVSRNNFAVVASSEAAEFSLDALAEEGSHLTKDESATIFLGNKYRKLVKRVAQIDEDIEKREKTLQGLKRLLDVYEKDPAQGDIGRVRESILEEKRETMKQQTSRSKFQVQIDRIYSLLSSDLEDMHPHNLTGKTFVHPVTCDYCHGTIWGVGKPGLTCDDCGYHAHLKCELKIPALCPGVMNKRRTFLDSRQSLAMSSVGSISSILGSTKWYGGSSAYILYDYTPSATASEELQVAEAEIVKVVEHDDGSGWTLVEKEDEKGKVVQGLVPTSYMELASEAPVVAVAAEGSDVEAVASTASGKQLGTEVVVAYDYTAQTEEEMSITDQQVVWVVEEDVDGSGWVMASNGIRKGLVPAAYLRTP
ncbi:uncharacterized protein EV422DRAFT_526239 [Fimicolochytrium jonesii]|uniref:uncharacterized protein n=1 Tax=Fimicolochytrium jonesii TaxID=1396493 RepID=UPI0022FE5D69|nr:uncharacterized protein EV422DRAFT_526239 [Fimicolochytrium jonesii]KAI8822262.1 hypothetical protein EV422DRAFT_526239 [Fimicolochytrium jonesii]